MGVESEATIAGRTAVEAYAREQGERTQFTVADVNKALPGLEYRVVTAALDWLSRHGIVNNGKDPERGARKIYWLRAKGEQKKNHKIRHRGNGLTDFSLTPVVPPAPAPQPELALQPVDIAPARMQITPPAGRLTDAPLARVCDDLCIEVSGKTLTVEYAPTGARPLKLVIEV